jgi:hypothetical protein
VGNLGWWQALDYCESLSFVGHDDWRLPNVRELQSIVDYGRSEPAISPVFGAWSSQYWSSTSNALNHSDSWVVDYYDDSVSILFEIDGSCAPRGCRLPVRAVRGAP